MQDRLEEAETRENQSREEGEKAKADLFQVGHHLYTFIRYPVLNIRLACSWYPIFKIKSSIVPYTKFILKKKVWKKTKKSPIQSLEMLPLPSFYKLKGQ